MLQDMLEVATRKLEEQLERGSAESVPQFVFAEEDPEMRQRTHYPYLIGLAFPGLGNRVEAKAALHTVIEPNPNHTDAIHQLQRMRLEED